MSLNWQDNMVILEMIGTGLGETSEVLEVAIVDLSGEILYHSLVKAKGRISAKATEIHGIKRSMIQDAPAFSEVWNQMKDTLKDKIVLTGQENHTVRLLQNSFYTLDDSIPEAMSIPEMQSVLAIYANEVGSKKMIKLESLVPDSFDHRAISRASVIRSIGQKCLLQFSETIIAMVEEEASHDDGEITIMHDETCEEVQSESKWTQIHSEPVANESLHRKIKKWWERLNQLLRNQIK
ncbi:DNA polymerase III alpha subunit (gram-positive type) [Croceifilum oryzae]|uniref:DNA polymerase III alpha subunit (Gram-positive type) n=1 Tax=Croceifilum oryzae TaxID=1553429 RepID=A0AAJ1TDE5_9BACL|nr:exonuclease domain-containing protein [Croceifilum oryzae]MDQ0416778.1 DNA polymerase III alpha subunit (gram-positive type) [Croceifilum oryzae]